LGISNLGDRFGDSRSPFPSIFFLEAIWGLGIGDLKSEWIYVLDRAEILIIIGIIKIIKLIIMIVRIVKLRRVTVIIMIRIYRMIIASAILILPRI